MSIIEIVVTFVLTWWLVFFLALPWGNQPEDNPMVGQASSAPKNPRIKLKIWVSTGITIIITLILYIVMG